MSEGESANEGHKDRAHSVLFGVFDFCYFFAFAFALAFAFAFSVCLFVYVCSVAQTPSP